MSEMENLERIEKDVLVSTLQQLIAVIAEIRAEDDFYVLEENEKKTQEWLVDMNDIDDKESLELFADQVKGDIYYDFYDDLSNHVLDKKRKELMMDFLARAYAYSK